VQTLWPWLAVAGLGALHGLSPANGWMFAAACGVRAGSSAQARRALLPIAIGHAASIAVVVSAIVFGVLMERALVQGVAGALLICVAAYRLLRNGAWRTSSANHPAGMHIAGTHITERAGHAGIALWSCLMATAHGAGLMLVPALVPLCMADTPAREITASGSLVLASAAFGLHMVAMLVTTGVIASGVCRGVALHPRLLGGTAMRRVWTAMLVITGALLMALR
jgi:hypothetical protein